jgi:hypothetical protein
MPLKKFTSRLSLLRSKSRRPFWWNEAEASFVLCLIHKPKFYFLMNLLQELIPFPERVLGYVKRLQQKGLRYWSPRPTWMKPLYVTGLHWFKRGYFKDWYAYNIISNYDKTIYNVRTRIPTN